MRFTLPLLFLVSACQPADADRDAGPVPARDADSARHDDRRPDGDDRRPDGDDDDPPTPDAGLDDPDAAPPETPDAAPPETPDAAPPGSPDGAPPETPDAGPPPPAELTCETAADVLQAALVPAAFDQWSACIVDTPCDEVSIRACLGAMDCDVEQLAGAHCDTLGRCGNQGRGYFFEDACRADPYEEARTWSCLVEPRREAVLQCLSGNICDDMDACLANAACAGDIDCMDLLGAVLLIDCHGVCDGCGPNNVYGDCMRACHNVARLFEPQDIREVESCARDVGCEWNPVTECVGRLECGANQQLIQMHQNAAHACQRNHFTRPGEARGWDCLGQVYVSAIEACLDQAGADCDAVQPCLDALELP